MLAAQLATAAVQAAIWPHEIPSPTPEPIYAVLLSASVRFGTALMQGNALPVVSESLGSYSYRLATPSTMAGAFGLTSSEVDALGPWGPSSAYDFSVAGRGASWPVDWWQRNLDNADLPC